MAGSQAACAATPPTAAEAELAKAEDALFAADISHDTAVIDRGFADEARFVHANGMVQTKADYIAAARKPGFVITSISTRDRVVRIFGDVGVVSGTKKLTVGSDLHLAGTYLSVYVRRDGRWRLLDEQSSPEPHPPGQQ